MSSLAIAVLAVFLPLLAETAQTYSIAPSAGTTFQLEVQKTGLLRGKKHLFDVERYRGRLTYDPSAPDRSALSLEIESASVICKDTWVSPKDLKKVQAWTYDEMLKIKEHPKLTFTLAQATATGMGKFTTTGTLNVRGVAKPVKVDVAVKEESTGLRIDGRSTFRMSDYGMKPPTAALGTIGTKDEVVVTFSLVAR